LGQRKKVPVAHKLADFLDIPLDTVIDWPRMTLSGNKNLTIINHRGVIEYDQTLVRINTRFGELKISGSGLTLVSAVKDEVVVDGKINQLEWIDWR
jgi:sporulation protein YqfC